MKKSLLFSCLAFAGSRGTAGPPVIHKPLVSAAIAFALRRIPDGEDDTTTKK